MVTTVPVLSSVKVNAESVGVHMLFAALLAQFPIATVETGIDTRSKLTVCPAKMPPPVIVSKPDTAVNAERSLMLPVDGVTTRFDVPETAIPCSAPAQVAPPPQLKQKGMVVNPANDPGKFWTMIVPPLPTGRAVARTFVGPKVVQTRAAAPNINRF